MRSRSWMFAVICLALVSGPTLAQGEAGTDEAAMMEAMEKAGTPGPHHEAMARLAGKWNATLKMWERPGAEPAVFEGTMTNKMVMGGRYHGADLRGRGDGRADVR